MSLLLPLHLFALGFSAALIALADKEAFAWFRGARLKLERARLNSYHFFMWAGLLTLVGSGIFLLYPFRLYLLKEPLFVAKLFFVGVLFINAILIGRLQRVATTRSYSSLSLREKAPLFVSGAVSLYCWLAAAALGYIVTNL